jgi:hypothetical protein
VAVLLPAALTLYLGFGRGGYFLTETGIAAAAVALVLLIHLLTSARPLAGLSRALGVAAGALLLFAGWALLSGVWSDAPGRALPEYDRALLYALALLAAGLLAGSSDRLRWALRLVAAAGVVICAAALAARLLPDAFSVPLGVEPERLSWPLTYWNSLGLLAVVTATFALYLAADEREHVAVRAAGAAALPLLAAVVVLTFSRGAVAAACIALVLLALVARPRLLGPALVATGPPTAVAVVVTYGAEALASADPTGQPAVEQGHELAVVVTLAILGAALLRLCLIPADRWLTSVRMRPRTRRRIAAGMAATALLAFGAAVVVADLPERLDRQLERFAEGVPADEPGAIRDRLMDPGASSRIDHWRVSLDEFAAEPLLGSGGGTYRLAWELRREDTYTVNEGHSLYLETLGEYGVVGLVLLLAALGTLLGAIALRARGRARPGQGALLAAAVAWAVHAGVDWHWEMPAATVWLFALGGVALAGAGGRQRAETGGRGLRLGAAAALLVLAVAPIANVVAQRHFERASRAYGDGRCRDAVDAALDSTAVLPVRAEPYLLLAYCDVKLGDPALGVRAAERAVDRDPDNWQTSYALALVSGAAGLDPRPALAQAIHRNPREPILRVAEQRLDGADSARWSRTARRLPLPR